MSNTRIKQKQAKLHRQGFWLPTVLSFFDTPRTYTQKEWRDRCDAAEGGYAPDVPLYKVPMLKARLEDAALQHGISSLRCFKDAHYDLWYNITASMAKMYKLRKESVRRDFSREFRERCQGCYGEGTEVLYWGDDGEPDTLRACQCCRGSGYVTWRYEVGSKRTSLKLHGEKMAISIPQEATKAQAQPIAPNFDRFAADRAKTAKRELSDVVLTKDMTQGERRSAFLAAIGR